MCDVENSRCDGATKSRSTTPVKKSIVWTAAAVAAVGFAVPAFAAISAPGHIRQIAPTPVVSVDQPDGTISTVDDSATSVSLASLPDETDSSTANSVEDISGNCDEAEHATDAECVAVDAGVPGTSTPGDDVSGNCDEAEHANDPSCTGAASDDNSGKGSSNSGSSDSSDSSGSSGSGHGSDDSGHGGGDG